MGEQTGQLGPYFWSLLAIYLANTAWKSHVAVRHGSHAPRSVAEVCGLGRACLVQAKQEVVTMIILVWCFVWLWFTHSDWLKREYPWFRDNGNLVWQFAGVFEIHVVLRAFNLEVFDWRRLWRWRPASIPLFVWGFVVAWGFIWVVPEQKWMGVAALTGVQLLLFRNAAIHGLACAYLLQVLRCQLCQHSNVDQHPNDEVPCGDFCEFSNVKLPILTVTYLRVLAGMAETSRNTRSFILLAEYTNAGINAMSVTWPSADGQDYTLSNYFLFSYLFVLAHLLNMHVKMVRPVHDWAATVSFLRLGELRRCRRASTEFKLLRRQDMDPALYGDPAAARHIVAVSHAWLSPGDADPDGFHLDLMIERLHERLCPYKDPIRAWWWRLYVYGAEADVLVFFDMSSLHQAPRSAEETASFKEALALMPYLYGYFEVLVIDEIPPNVTYGGRKVEYLDKGWCWAEANQAGLMGELRLSPSIKSQLNQERHVRRTIIPGEGSQVWDSLWGNPRYPPDLLGSWEVEDLLAFRDSQVLAGKVFTSGRVDLERVTRQLRQFVAIRRLREGIQKDCGGDCGEVAALFAEPEETGFASEALANAVFDSDFTTPLHLATAKGNKELVEILLASGARPQRNYWGDLPWEMGGFLRWSAAARAARRNFQFPDGSSTCAELGNLPLAAAKS